MVTAVDLPFIPTPAESHSLEDLKAYGIYRLLSKDAKKHVTKKPHVLEYVHMLPIDEIGMPKFVNRLSGDIKNLKNPNLIYSITNDLSIHIYPDDRDVRDYYIPIEPVLFRDIDPLIEKVEYQLAKLVKETDKVEESDEKKELLLDALDKICIVDKSLDEGGGEGDSEEEEEEEDEEEEWDEEEWDDADLDVEEWDGEDSDDEDWDDEDSDDEDSDDEDEDDNAKVSNKKPQFFNKIKALYDTKINGKKSFDLENIKGLLKSSSSNEVEQIRVSEADYKALKYLMIRDKVGMGVLQPFISDPNIEDISCTGLGPIFIEHKIFESVKATIGFNDHETLDKFVLNLAERSGRPVSYAQPVMDAALPDGSRINIVFGKEISKRGSNFTIRKFSDTPISILQLIEFGSLDYRIAAYLWIMLNAGLNIFVAGETASGKTTLMNAITTFLPVNSKVVSIENTPEVQIPHKNWIREVNKEESKMDTGEVTMFDLLKAALRQRPNEIIIGEIRGEEGKIAFQAMQTGHPVMSTFHAASVQKLIRRLTGDPINIPKAYLDNLNLVVIQHAVRGPDGKLKRRVVSVNELVGYDPVKQDFNFVETFSWDPIEDRFIFNADNNSYLLEYVIAPQKGIPRSNIKAIYQDVEKRAKILERIHTSGTVDFYDLFTMITKIEKERIVL